jgi:hypothetical protein
MFANEGKNILRDMGENPVRSISVSKCGGVFGRYILKFSGLETKKAPEDFGGAWKRIWKTLSDHAPLADYDDEFHGHCVSPLMMSVVRQFDLGNLKSCRS